MREEIYLIDLRTHKWSFKDMDDKSRAIYRNGCLHGMPNINTSKNMKTNQRIWCDFDILSVDEKSYEEFDISKKCRANPVKKIPII